MAGREGSPSSCPHHTRGVQPPSLQMWSWRWDDQETGRICGSLRHVWGTSVGHKTRLTQHCVCRNQTCITENRESTVCVCDMLVEDPVRADTYELDLWAGKQLLWSGFFKPSKHGEWRGAAGVRTASCALGPEGQALFGRDPKYPCTLSQTCWGSCPFLGLSPSIFGMGLSSAVHQAPFSSDISSP